MADHTKQCTLGSALVVCVDGKSLFLVLKRLKTLMNLLVNNFSPNIEKKDFLVSFIHYTEKIILSF